MTKALTMCSECHTAIYKGEICPHCGSDGKSHEESPIVPVDLFCVQCGTAIDKTTHKCPTCDAQLIVPSRSDKSSPTEVPSFRSLPSDIRLPSNMVYDASTKSRSRSKSKTPICYLNNDDDSNYDCFRPILHGPAKFLYNTVIFGLMFSVIWLTIELVLMATGNIEMTLFIKSLEGVM